MPPWNSPALKRASSKRAVDFVPAEQVLRHGRARSPFELGLDWLVDFDKGHFTGRSALLRERAQGSRFRFVRLDVEGNKPAPESFILNKRGKTVGPCHLRRLVPVSQTQRGAGLAGDAVGSPGG